MQKSHKLSVSVFLSYNTNLLFFLGHFSIVNNFPYIELVARFMSDFVASAKRARPNNMADLIVSELLFTGHVLEKNRKCTCDFLRYLVIVDLLIKLVVGDRSAQYF